MQNIYRSEAFYPRLPTVVSEIDQIKIYQDVPSKCSPSYDIHFNFNDGWSGVIPKDEVCLDLYGSGLKFFQYSTLIGRPTCFRVESINHESKTLILSRKSVQKEYVDYFYKYMKPGDIIQATVQSLAPFGAFIDIGVGITSLIHINDICINRIAHPSQILTIGQPILAVVKALYPKILLSHKELLGTWDELAKNYTVGDVVVGKISGIEDYGMFIGLYPNLVGLAEIPPNFDINNSNGLVLVSIRSISPESMKIKLDILSSVFSGYTKDIDYKYRAGDRIDTWIYSPVGCSKTIITCFD